MTCSNTNPAAAQAFALAGIAAATGVIFYHHPVPFAAAIFPMASAAVRMGRVRSLKREAERAITRERERLEREAHARRFAAETRAAQGKPPQTPEMRERRRAAAAKAREAETARLNAETTLAFVSRRAIDDFRYHAETVRLRDEYAFSPDNAFCRGREPPALNGHGEVPGMDATGRVLAQIGRRLAYVRRTRLFASLALLTAYRLASAVKQHPAEAERMGVAREARALFWDTLSAMRALDRKWGL